MTRQEQAFSAYYASMTDAGLLSIAANRTSFIEVAQKALDQELAKRSLTVPPEALRGVIVQFEGPASSVFSGLAKMLWRILRH
jgi:hypothetical protein